MPLHRLFGLTLAIVLLLSLGAGCSAGFSPLTPPIGMISGMVDLTQPWLSMNPIDVLVHGNVALVLSYPTGLHVFDLANPVDPIWKSNVEMDSHISEKIAAKGDYAYIVHHLSLDVIDINPPEEAHIVQTIDTLPGFMDVAIEDDNLYIIGDRVVMQIIDISNPDTAFIAQTHIVPNDVKALDVMDGIAYLAAGYGELHIIDTKSGIIPQTLNVLDAEGYYTDLQVSEGYAYGCNWHGLVIIDVDPPEDAYIVDVIDIHYAYALEIRGNYAYVIVGNYGSMDLNIVDISQPKSASIIYTLPMNGRYMSFSMGVKHLYLAVQSEGIWIIDIDPPGMAAVVNSILCIARPYDISVSENYAAVIDSNSGLKILDVSSPYSARVIKSLPSHSPRGVAVKGSYAYLADNHDGLRIYDLDSPNLTPIAEIELIPRVNGLVVEGKYAYAISDYYGLQIIDISNPYSANIVQLIDTGEHPTDLAVRDGKAFVVDENGGLVIVDVTSPGFGSVISNIAVSGEEGAYAIAVIDNNRVCISSVAEDPPAPDPPDLGHNGDEPARMFIDIIDVSIPTSPAIINTIELEVTARDLERAGSYILIALGEEGIKIADVSRPGEEYLIDDAGVDVYADKLLVDGDFVYVMSGSHGFKIFKLYEWLR